MKKTNSRKMKRNKSSAYVVGYNKLFMMFVVVWLLVAAVADQFAEA